MPEGAVAVTIRETEFAVLRQTIATRGTARAAVLVGIVVAWGALASVQGLFADLPLLALVPLVVLGGGLRGRVGPARRRRTDRPVHPGHLRVGTRTARRGRPRRCERRPGLPGSGADPLFTVVFAAASLVNLGVAFVAQPTPIEVVLLFGCSRGSVAAAGTSADRGRASAPRRSRGVHRCAPGHATVTHAADPSRRDFAGNQELLTKRGIGPRPSR